MGRGGGSEGTDGTNLWNNTIYGCYRSGYLASNTNFSNQNNLVYNCTNTVAGLTNYGSDPKFVSVITPDFHLQSSSPVIDQGVDVGLPYNGGAPDLGAYEYQSTTLISISGGSQSITIGGGNQTISW